MKRVVIILFVMFLIIGMVLFLVGGVSATDIYVATPVTAAAINSAIVSAQPGDCVIIPDGTYSNLNQITVPSDVDGTEANPITLKAATAGGVTFTGNSAAPLIFVQGDWWIIRDFKFIDISEVGDANTYGIVTRDATGTRVTNTYWEGFAVLTDPDKYNWCIWIGSRGTGHHSRVDHNTFIENNAVHITLSHEAMYCRVDHNYLKDSLSPSGGFGGLPTMHIGGDRWRTQIDLYTTFEYNLFEDTLGAEEAIANKASSNTYQYNVFKSTEGKKSYGLVLRGGDDCIINGNYFFDIDKQNIRVHGTGHKIINNYFENPGYSAILLAEGGVNYQHVSDIFIANNLIVNPVLRGIHIGWWPSGDVKPNNLAFKNNMITSNVANSYLVKDSGHTGTFIWENNLHYATGGASYWINDGGGNEPSSGITHANPNLIQGTYIQRLQSSSNNAIEKGTPVAIITDDIDGHSRDGTNPDIGCDEYSASAPLRLPVTENDVGVSWLMATQTCTNQGHNCCDSCESGPQPLYDADCPGQVCCEVCYVQSFLPEQYIEAEDGIINSPMLTGSDSSASSGKYIYVPVGTGDSSTPTAEAVYPINIASANIYYLWFLMYGETSDNDALYIGFNGNFDRHYPTPLQEYVWVKARTNYSLIEGINEIQISHGEELARADKIIVTSDPDFVPGVSTTCSDADTNTDGTVSIEEIINYMTEWKAGTVSIENLMIGIGEWKNGCV